MGLWILRGLFFLVSLGAGWSFITMGSAIPASNRQVAFVVVLLTSGTMIVMDTLIPRKRIEIITCVYFGIFVGLFLSFYKEVEDCWEELQFEHSGVEEVLSRYNLQEIYTDVDEIQALVARCSNAAREENAPVAAAVVTNGAE